MSQRSLNPEGRNSTLRNIWNIARNSFVHQQVGETEFSKDLGKKYRNVSNVSSHVRSFSYFLFIYSGMYVFK